MNSEQLSLEIIKLWHEIEPDIKISVANAWEKRDKLGILKSIVKSNEEKVLEILRKIPRLSEDSEEFKTHAEDLVRLIKAMKPNDDWYARIRSDVEFIVEELAKIRISVRERWNLQPEMKKELEVFKELLTEFLTAFHDYIKGLVEARKTRIPKISQLQINQLVPIYDNLREFHKMIEDVLSGRAHPSTVTGANQRITTISLRDFIIVCLDVFQSNGQIEILNDSKLRPFIDKMLKIAMVQLILPKLGDNVDVRTMIFEPMGVISEHRRGSVARIIKVGYITENKVFSPARVEVSSGPPK